MKKSHISKVRVDQEMDSEYHFDYKKAKPNRFAEKMNLNVGWTVEKFVEEEKKESGKKKEGKSKKAAPAKKAKPAAKKPATKAKPAKKKKK